MTAYACEFYGGPLAGQVHMIETPPTRYRVPSFTRPTYTEESPARVEMSRFEIEEYELGPNRSHNAQFTYTWVNPASSLRDALKTQTESKEYYRQKYLAAEAGRAALEPDAERWRSLKGSLADLVEEL